MKNKFKEAREKPQRALEIYNNLTTTYQTLTAKLDFWYKKSKDNYSNYKNKKQVQSKSNSKYSLKSLDQTISGQ